MDAENVKQVKIQLAKAKLASNATTSMGALKNPLLLQQFIEKVEANPKLTRLLESVKGKKESASLKRAGKILSRGQRKREDAKKKV